MAGVVLRCQDILHMLHMAGQVGRSDESGELGDLTLTQGNR